MPIDDISGYGGGGGAGGGIEIPITMLGAQAFGANAYMVRNSLNMIKIAVEAVGASGVALGGVALGIGAIGVVLTKWGTEYGKYIMQIDKIDRASKASSDQTQRLAQVYQLHGKSIADLGKEMAALEKAGINPMAEGFERLARSLDMTAPELTTAMSNLKGFIAFTPEMVASLKAQEDGTNRLALAWKNFKDNAGISTAGITGGASGLIADILEGLTPGGGQATYQRGGRGISQTRNMMPFEPAALGAGWSKDLGRWRTMGAGAGATKEDFQKQADATIKFLAEQEKLMGTRLDMTKSITGATEDYTKSLEDLNKQLQEAYVKGDKEAITKTGEQIKQVTEARGDQQKEWVLSMLKATEGVSQDVTKQYMLGVGLITQEGLAYEAKLTALIQGAIGGDIQSLVNFVQQVPTIAGGGAAGAKAKFWRPQDFPDVSGYKQKIRAAQMANQFGYGAEPAPTVGVPYAGRGPFEDAGPPTMGQKRGAQAPGIGIGDYNEGLRGAKILQSELGNQAITDGQNIALGLQPAKSVVDDIKQTYLDFINAPAQKTVTVTYITRYVTETAINEP